MAKDTRNYPPPGSSLQNGADFVPLEDLSSVRYKDPSGRGSNKRKASALDDDTASSDPPGLERTAPWIGLTDMRQCRTAIDMLNAEVESFYRYVAPTQEEHYVRTMIIECIRRAIVQRWPSAAVYAFGSQETQLYLPNGDIDLVVHYDRISVDRKPDVVAFLYEISQLLQKVKVSRRITVISRAKVPIIKFVTSTGHYAVDISVNQLNGIRAIGVVNRFIQHMPAVPPLVMLIKAFLLQRGLNEPYSGGFGSYTVICLVISLLQMHPKVRRREIGPECNLGVLLLEFMELYGRIYNYNDVGISLRDGGSYFSQQERGWGETARMQMSIEDPLDPTNDVARSSSPAKVRDAFAAAFETLSTSISIRAQEIHSRQSGRHVDLGSNSHRPQSSLLDSVVSLPQIMLNFRHEVQDLYDSGVLQDFLELPFAPPPSRSPFLLHKTSSHRSDTARHRSFRLSADGSDQEHDGPLKALSGNSEPESRYGLGNTRHKLEGDRKAVVFVSDERIDDSASDMSLSPPAEPVGTTEGRGTTPRLDRTARRAFWTSKNGRYEDDATAAEAGD